MAEDSMRRTPPLDTGGPMPESAYRIDDARAAELGVAPMPSTTGRAHGVGAGPIPRLDASAPRIDEAQRGGTETEAPDSGKTVPPSPALPEVFSERQFIKAYRLLYLIEPAKRWDVMLSILAERDRLETECRDLADKLDGANIRYAQLFVRCEAAERERDEARAAGRALVAENAALRAERDRGRQLAQQVTHHLRSILALYDDISQNPRGGPPEARSDAKAILPPKTDSVPL